MLRFTAARLARRCAPPAPVRRRFSNGGGKKKKEAKAHGAASDPIGGILFGRNASLPAMVLLLCGFVFFNYQEEEALKAQADELKNERTHLARIKRERAERQRAVDAPSRLAFKEKQLAFFAEERRERRGDSATLDARIARLEDEVRGLRDEAARAPPPAPR